MTDDEAKAIVLIVIEFLEKLDRMEIGDQFPNYTDGLWDRKNIRALVEDLKGDGLKIIDGQAAEIAKLRVENAELRFELKAKQNELEIADAQIERLLKKAAAEPG